MNDAKPPLLHDHSPDTLALEQARLAGLIAHAARGDDLMQHIAYGTLFVHPETRLIVEVNDAAAVLLGATADALIGQPIDALELRVESAPAPDDPPRHPTIDAHLYSALYRHGSGQPLAVTVQRQRTPHQGQMLVMYRLIDRSLYGQVWYELKRREDDGFRFQQKLADLNQVAIQLNQMDSFDAMCRGVVALGMERLGFDRLGLWLVDHDTGQMRGTYGTDETGGVRAEHDQSWYFAGTLVSGLIDGALDTPFIYSESPLLNDRSEAIGYGWHLTVPVNHDNRWLGIITVDNFRFRQPIRNYEPELLRLYGTTVAQIMALHHSREQALALRMASERARMLEEFITSIGHDFRAPLATIRTESYIIRRISEDERVMRSSARIDSQVVMLSETMTRMLEFIRLQSGITLARVAVTVGALIAEVLDAHQDAIARKSIQTGIALDADPTVSVDRAYMVRALSEIVDNALRYTDAGGALHFGCASSPDRVTLAIRDSGVGMDADTLARIFEPLFRGDSARSERRSGFGLAIASAIVQAHDGAITAASAPDAGALFEITLPR